MATIKLAIAAGGTGGHIFPAYAVALEWMARQPQWPLLWVGTTRSRERELCERSGIRLVTIDVQGIKRTVSLQAVGAAMRFVKACVEMRRLLAAEGVNAVLAFGGYVSGPVLLAARIRGIPYFLQEQNTVPGLVNRLFSAGARRTFLGFPINGHQLKGATMLTGTPVRAVSKEFDSTAYPEGFDRSLKTVLICGGSQGAQSMNRCLVPAVLGWLASGVQVVWQTGEAGFVETRDRVAGRGKVFVFATISDLYPFYAAARVVVGRAGASTISEIAYFGLPCVLIPLPWATEDHQWKNAGLVEGQHWGVRVRQDESCAAAVDSAVRSILADDATFERMSREALDHSPVAAGATIVQTIVESMAS